MKKLILLLLLGISTTAGFGQTDVYLKLNHMLGGAPFQFNMGTTNNMNTDFDVTRLQYYISEVTLIHDGGTQLTVPNLWLLADASAPLNEYLGNFPITNLEGIQFGIGVESATNHLDPSSYAASHPLAPQNPSMHWGWTSGYRFVAMEGKCGLNLNNTYAIHALDDINYFQVNLTTTGIANGTDLTVELNADYEMALFDISIASGLFNHGSQGEAVDLLENFRDRVFTPAEVTTTVDPTLEDNYHFAIAPNPINTSQTTAITGNFPSKATIQVSDLLGKTTTTPALRKGFAELQLPEAGFYLVSVWVEGQTVAVKRLLVTQ